MKKTMVIGALALLGFVSCKKADFKLQSDVDSTAVDSTKVDTVVVDSTKVDTVVVDSVK